MISVPMPAADSVITTRLGFMMIVLSSAEAAITLDVNAASNNNILVFMMLVRLIKILLKVPMKRCHIAGRAEA